MAEYNGAFADMSAIDLGVHAAAEALKRSGVEPAQVDHVIFGNVLQTSGDAIYGARHVGLKAGVPKEVPALTVNRLCGSGFESIVQGAQRILLGEAETVLAGGMENMSQAPHVIRGARKGLRLGQGAARGHADGRAPGLLLRALHGADLGPRRREVRHHARGAGRLCSPLAAADGRGLGGLPPLGGGRPGRRQAGPEERARRERRPHAPRLDARRARGAAALVRQGRLRHGRQRLGHRRRRGLGRRRLGRRGAREEAARPDRFLGSRRRRAGADGAGTRAGGARSPREGRDSRRTTSASGRSTRPSPARSWASSASWAWTSKS